MTLRDRIVCYLTEPSTRSAARGHEVKIANLYARLSHYLASTQALRDDVETLDMRLKRLEPEPMDEDAIKRWRAGHKAAYGGMPVTICQHGFLLEDCDEHRPKQ